MKNVKKAYEIVDAKIQFVSLVNKAANKKQFLITKADDDQGSATFQSFGRIIKTDEESHFVTGIVYEPMVEDSQGEYMTAEEITKAAHWYMKHDGDVDIQHCFEKAKGVEVVESYVAKGDMEIAGTDIKEGTWIMTMEVTDGTIWDAIQKGEITGFSMGGTGSVSTVDDDISSEDVEKTEKKSLFKKFAKAFGFDVVEKGAVKDSFNSRQKNDGLYNAWSALRDSLEGYQYNAEKGCYEWSYTADETQIRDAITDFNDIVTQLLTTDVSIVKAFEASAPEKPEKISKAGKSMSASNLEKLNSIASSLSDFIASFDVEKKQVKESQDNGEDPDKEDPEAKPDDSNNVKEDDGEDDDNKNAEKEEQDMKKSEVQALVSETVAKAMEPITQQIAELTKADGTVEEGADGIEKADDVEADSDDINTIVSEAVAKAMEPISQQLAVIKQSRALPSNLNDAHSDKVQKDEGQHYLKGIL